jgi:hypothetical protein
VTTAAAARDRRRRAAARYRPDVIDLLLVAEAPPSALDRYFYFEDVLMHDSLFRHVVQGVLGETPTRDKAPYLDELRDRGVFLVHVSEDPFRAWRDVPPECIAALAEKCAALRPQRIVLIGAGTYDHAYDVLRSAGLPVVDIRLPYPGSGQQRRFLEGFELALAVSD